MLPKLVNLKYDRGATPIDRSSYLGNPFYMANESQRVTVCWLYEMYTDQVMEGKEPVDAVEELRQIMQQYGIKTVRTWKKPTRNQFLAALRGAAKSEKIGCWCSPKACHGNIILNILGEKELELL